MSGTSPHAHPDSGSPDMGDEPCIRVVNLKKRYGSLEVLKGVSFDAHDKSVIALIGASGGGKSTLLRCLNLLEIPDDGTIALEGEELPLSAPTVGQRKITDPKRLRQVRSQLGMVFQNFNLWSHLSVIENVMEGLLRVLGQSRDEARSHAESILQRVGMGGKFDSWVSQLSGGQQQRVSIARALAMNPKVLLFDEPTSALDPELVGEVLSVMRGLADEGRTMIMATHEIPFAREAATEVIFLENGLIAESGKPEEILVSPKTESCQRFLARVL